MSEFSGQLRKLQGSSDAGRYLVFQLGQESYAVPLLKVREVMAPTEITPVPQTPAHYKGVMNLRGQVISVLDLRLKFKMKVLDEANPETAIIILDLEGMALGVIVDTVNAVVAFKPDQISASPDIESAVRSDYILGIARIDTRLILILDIEKSLSVEEISAMNRQARTSKAS